MVGERYIIVDIDLLSSRAGAPVDEHSALGPLVDEFAYGFRVAGFVALVREVVSQVRTRQDLLSLSTRILWRDGAEDSDRDATLPASPAAAYAILNDESLPA